MLGQLLLTVALLSNGTAVCGDDAPCGPSWMPDSLKRFIAQDFANADYRPACRCHDACYQASGISRRQCDRRFRRHLLAACRNSTRPIRCRQKANMMFVAVRVFGRRSYVRR